MGKISSRYSRLLRPEPASNEFWPTKMTLQTITLLSGHHSSSSRKFPLGGSAWKTQQHSFFVVDYVCSSGISRNLKSMWRNAGESHNFIHTRYCVDEMCPPTTDTNARLWHSNDLAIQWSAFYSLDYCTFLLMIRTWRLAEVVKLIIMWSF